MIPLDIPKRSYTCSQCKEVLLSSTDYYSILREDPEDNQRLNRLDFCFSCWETYRQNGSMTSFKSQWKAKVPVVKSQEDLSSNHDEKIFHMLREAMASSTSTSKMYLYVLALYLARKRQLIFRQELIRDEEVFSLYEVAATEEMLTIPKVALSFSEIQHVQGELTQKWKE